jgi:beta-galactosidase
MSFRYYLPIIALLAPVLASAQITAGRAQNFDSAWLFKLGDPAGADKPAFSDSDWRQLDLPHDWSIEGPIAETNPSGPRGGYFPAGIGWYRKHFVLSNDDAAKTIIIKFDGVMANSDVYINGTNVGHRPYGWNPFQYDITSAVTFGADKPNVISVRVDNSRQPASRFYEGAGIYRHVWIEIVDPTHIGQGGVYVTTSGVTAEKATVNIKTTIDNDSKTDKTVSVHAVLMPAGVAEAKGTPVPDAAAVTIPAGKSADISQTVTFSNPALWGLDHPNLYNAAVDVTSGNTKIDSQTVPFGIRDAVFKADTGFWLNGKNLKLLGVCIHSEGGAFGTAVPDSVWERRLSILKGLGANTIRTAHNPPSKDFLDICDRLGLMVMDEMFDMWNTGKYTDQDYHLYFRQWWQKDMTDTILRDRNHPSIVVWSAGNEIHDNLASDAGKAQIAAMVALFHKLDPAHPVTQAILQPVQNRIFTSNYPDALDVVGVNYHEADLLAEHKVRPDYKILGTENQHSAAVWLQLRDNPAYAGQMLWTGIDYLGEAGAWPRIGSGSGLIDRDGLIKTEGYQRQSWWSTTPMVYITRAGGGGGRGGAAGGRGAAAGGRGGAAGRGARGAAAGPTTTPALDAGDADAMAAAAAEAAAAAAAARGGGGGNVEVYSNCQSVELFLNGQSLGSKPKPANDSARTWNAGSGTLKAVGSNNGTVVATFELPPVGQATKLALSTEKTTLPHDWDDVATVAVMVADANGNHTGTGNGLVTFKISGPAKIAAVDNGDGSFHDSFQASEVRAMNGQCYVSIRSTADSGTITLTASTPGLADGTMTFTAQPAAISR